MKVLGITIEYVPDAGTTPFLRGEGGFPEWVDRRSGESEAAWLTRLFARAAEADTSIVISDPDDIGLDVASVITDLHQFHGGAAGSFRSDGCGLCPSESTTLPRAGNYGDPYEAAR